MLPTLAGLAEWARLHPSARLSVEGHADLQVGGVGYRLAEGDTLLMPANVPHAVSPTGPFKMLLVMLRADKAVQPG